MKRISLGVILALIFSPIQAREVSIKSEELKARLAFYVNLYQSYNFLSYYEMVEFETAQCGRYAPKEVSEIRSDLAALTEQVQKIKQQVSLNFDEELLQEIRRSYAEVHGALGSEAEMLAEDCQDFAGMVKDPMERGFYVKPLKAKFADPPYYDLPLDFDLTNEDVSLLLMDMMGARVASFCEALAPETASLSELQTEILHRRNSELRKARTKFLFRQSEHPFSPHAKPPNNLIFLGLTVSVLGGEFEKFEKKLVIENERPDKKNIEKAKKMCGSFHEMASKGQVLEYHKFTKALKGNILDSW